MNSLVHEGSWNDISTLKGADETLLSQLFSRSYVSITWKKKNTKLVYCIKFCTEYFIRVLKLVSKYISTPRFAHSCLNNGERKKRDIDRVHKLLQFLYHWHWGTCFKYHYGYILLAHPGCKTSDYFNLLLMICA